MKISPFKTILIFLVLVTLGIALIAQLPVKLQPAIILPSVTVSYSWGNATGRILEQKVTSKLEAMISRVRGVKKVSSVSSSNYGYVLIEFDKETDFDAVRFEISTIVRQAYSKFPQGVSYPTITANRPEDDELKPLLSYTINAPASPVLIQEFAENQIKPVLSTIKGINKIEIYGASPMEWILEYDVNQMNSLGVSVSDIQMALNTYLSRSDAGIGYDKQLQADTSMIRLVMRNCDPDKVDFLGIPVKKCGTRIVFLKDIVTLRHQEQVPNSYYRINGANSINIVIYAEDFENQLKLSDQIKKKMEEVKAKLPTGYFLINSFDATQIIRQELTKNAWRTIFTILILLLFVLAVSRQFQYLLLMVICLIANLAIAVIFYLLFNVEISLYSFAGIAISLGLMLENCIVMIEHFKRFKNRAIFMAILSATLTTIVALMSVVFLDDRIRLNLFDFSIIITINLAVSLIVAFFLIPAIMEKWPIRLKSKKSNRTLLIFHRTKKPKRRLPVLMARFYERLVKNLLRFRKTILFLVIITFGLPIFLLPNQINTEGLLGRFYNKTLGSRWYVENAKKKTEVALGGALRLFYQDVYQNSKISSMERTTLNVNAQMSFGSTIGQMNDLVKSLDDYLLGFKEIDLFQTSVSGGGNANVVIYFKSEYEKTGFPLHLKEQVIQKAIDLGGADWSVSGVGDGFNNSVYETLGSSRIKMYGFNYDELYHWAEVIKDSLMASPRIREVTILSRDSWMKDRSYEFVMDMDREKLITQNISSSEIHGSLNKYDLKENYVTTTLVHGKLEQVRLESKQKKNIDLWQLQRIPNPSGKTFFQIQDLASIKKEDVNLDICKENQQYRLILAYNYIGNESMGDLIQNRILKEVKTYLPLGYSAENGSRFGGMVSNAKKQYWLLVLVIVAIFFICSVLFESLLHPLAVIAMIPFSYIGLFLAFYFFELNFDQGGFAAFILLSGLSINPALYIINEYDLLRREYAGRKVSSYRLYIKAFNRKILSILLSVFAIILGLILFLVGGDKEAFWPGLAGGTIGGMLFSILGVVFVLPVVLLKKDQAKSKANGKNHKK